MYPRRLLLLPVLLATATAPAAAQSYYGFSLDGGQEVPPNGSSAAGDCVAALDEARTELTITCAHDVADVTDAHIHAAPAGSNGPVVFPFPVATSPMDGIWNLSPDDVADLEAGELYVNVHSTAFPGGEIRGQITAAAVETYSFPLEGGQEVPPNASAASGSCDGVLVDATQELLIRCHHADIDMPTAAHIHAAPAGANGGIVFPFDSATSPMFGVWTPDPDQLDELRSQGLYVNVHSMLFPGGEIRGQILPAPGSLVFSDGFETGDTEPWGAVVE